MDDVIAEISGSIRCMEDVARALSDTIRTVGSIGRVSMVGDSPTADKLYKAGLGLMFLVPVPVVSEAAGSLLIVLGKVLSERAKKPLGIKLGEAIDSVLDSSLEISGTNSFGDLSPRR